MSGISLEDWGPWHPKWPWPPGDDGKAAVARTVAHYRDRAIAAEAANVSERSMCDALVAAVLKFGEWDAGTKIGDAIAAIAADRASRKAGPP